MAEAERAPLVWMNGKAIPFLQHYRYPRQDVAASARGWAWEYLAAEAMTDPLRMLEVDFGWKGEERTRFEEQMDFVKLSHRGLLCAEEVLHRSDIYGSGPPNEAVQPEVFALVKQLKGPVLDFGCGRGLTVEALRKLGIPAEGLELDSPVIRACALPSTVTLYDGTFPSPMEAGRFASVICSEVLEHIPDYEGALREIARLAGEQALFTVPDMSAVPMGYQYGAVPWHLLESTHVNFFTQQSLQRLLGRYFSKIEFGRIGAAWFGETMYFTSLTARCWK